MKIIMYSTGCPQCQVLKRKLDSAGVEYETVTDTKLMIRKGFSAVPVLEIDGECLSFAQAMKWVKER